MTPPAVTHRRQQTGDGVWELIDRPPDPCLTGVLSYSGYREAVPGGVRRAEMASTIVPLILNFGPTFRILEPGSLAGGSDLDSFAAGLSDCWTVTQSSGHADCLQVNLTPFAARRVLGQPLDSIANRAVSLEDLLGAEAARLTERLAEANNWTERFDMVDAFLVRRLAGAAEPDPGVAWAWRRLESVDGALRIGELARELGWSRRRLIDRFRSDVGLPPKVVARLLRFQGLRRQLRHRPKTGWAALATLAGYHDQPHLSREVRQFTGLTPEALRLGPGPEAESVTLVEGTGKSVQDSGGGQL